MSQASETFALGVTLSECGTGQSLFPNSDIINLSETEAPAVLERLHEQVRFVIMQFLRREPSSRTTAVEFLSKESLHDKLATQ